MAAPARHIPRVPTDTGRKTENWRLTNARAAPVAMSVQ